MPIKVPSKLPAIEVLNRENIFIMDEHRAVAQDIRPLRIVILNLMPKKIDTETQLLRLLGNTPLQIEVELMQTATYTSRNTSPDHLLQFYKTFQDLKHQKFDGMVITGAPVEQMDFEEVAYWEELREIMEWTKTNVFSTLHICWGAQAGLYHHYGVQKYMLPKKMFGIFEHNVLEPDHALLHGFDEIFLAPHSRHTEIREDAIRHNPHLTLLSTSVEAGVYMVADDQNNFYITGHSEYDRDTLAGEYFRDVEKGLLISLPVNYFPYDNPANSPMIRWRSHANILFSNWLNYFVYQETPYDYVQ